MLVLVIGLLLFLGIHSIRIVADDWRTAQVAKMGPSAWKGLYTVVSLVGFGLIIWGFGMARMAPIVVWSPPTWTRHLAGVIMILAFILLVAAYVPGNSLRARIGHPMLAGTRLWAIAHLIANGTLVDIILFGSFLIWTTFAFSSAQKRDRAAGVTYPVRGGRDLLTIAIGIVLWAAFAFYGHLRLIGVSPF